MKPGFNHVDNPPASSPLVVQHRDFLEAIIRVNVLGGNGSLLVVGPQIRKTVPRPCSVS